MLAPVQVKAISLAVTPKQDGTMPSITRIMIEVKKPREYWYRWLKCEEFREAYNLASDVYIGMVVRKELTSRLSQVGFPLDKIITLYLADKPQKIETKSETKTEITIEHKTKAEVKDEIKAMLKDLEKYANSTS